MEMVKADSRRRKSWCHLLGPEVVEVLKERGKEEGREVSEAQ